MRKVLFALIILSFLLFLVHCSKKNETEPSPTPGYGRNVIIEFFTYAGCPNCPLAEKAVDSLVGEYGDSLIVIEYHKNILGDTLTPCSTFVKAREDMYNVSGYPTAVFDGVEEKTGATGDVYAVYLNIIKDRFLKKSNLKVQNLEAHFVNNSSINFNLNISSDEDISGKLFIVLTEDSVIFKDSTFRFVARQVYPDNNGIDFFITADNPSSASGSIPVLWQPTGDVWLCIFVQDMNNKTIFQADDINIGKPPVNPYKFEFSVFPDTSQTVLADSTATFYFYLKNTGTVADTYHVVASQVDTVPGWQWLMCSGGICHMPASVVEDTLEVAPQVVDTFDVKVNTNSTPGIEKINVKVTSFADTTLSDAINIYTEVK